MFTFHAAAGSRSADLSPRSIIVLRALQFGDLLCAVPAFRALRHAYPRAHIALISLPWAKTFVSRFHQYLDEFISFPGYPGLPEIPAEIEKFPEFLTTLQRRHFDLAIQMHGSGPFVNSIVSLLGAKETAGFYLPGDYRPNDKWFIPFPDEDHEVRKFLRLMQHLGIPSQGEELEYPLTEQDVRDFESIPETRALQTESVVCIHPGARMRSRRWSAQRFAEVADALAAAGLSIVITGSSDEKSIADTVQAAMKHDAVNLAGKTSMGALGVLLKHARLLISNDTGVSHVAAGLKTPSVIVTSGSDPKRWAPLDQARHRAVFAPIDCRPCAHDVCPIGQTCSELVSVSDVVTAAREVLEASKKTEASQPVFAIA